MNRSALVAFKQGLPQKYRLYYAFQDNKN